MANVRRISLPILVVLFIILFVYFTVIFLVIDPWLDLFTAPGLMNAIIFSILSILVFISYAIAIFKDPGTVPPHYFPEIEENSTSLIQEVKRKGGELRYCQKCLHYKPPRTHHCRVCKRCVLRMDHHCIWINNCVGHFNYKSFLLLVFYIVLAVFHAVILLLCQITTDFSKDDEKSKSTLTNKVKSSFSPNDATSALLRAFCLFMCLILFITVGILLIWNIYLLFVNKTTIEYHEGIRAKLLSIEKPNEIISHPYDMGWFANLIISLGPNFMCWFFPNLTNEWAGDGVHFLTVYNHHFMKQREEKIDSK